MPTPAEQAFLDRIRTNEGILRKVVSLYADQRADREDLYQEIVLQAWRAFPRFKGKSKFSTWLYQVALNTALTYRRQVARAPKQREVLEQDAVGNPEPAREARQVLLWAIRQLPETDRMITLLHLEGYDNGEIANIAGLKRNHVGVKLHRIKSRLNEIIQREQAWT